MEKARLKLLYLFSFSFIFPFSFHEVENVHEVGCTSPPPSPWVGADLNLANRNTPIFAYTSHHLMACHRQKEKNSRIAILRKSFYWMIMIMLAEL